jgi:putative lipoprotein (rSAM/lipoprotein system)
MKTLYGIFVAAAVTLMSASCSKEQVGDPYMLFEIHGKVMDGDGNPLCGIQVSSGLSDVQTTDVNGVFAFYGRSTPTSLVILDFVDKDGESNGGEFLKRTKEITVNEKTPGSAVGNFRGTYFAGDVEVVMLKKNDQINTTPESGLIPL